MHTHTISYTNFNGEERTKQLNFNLTEAELTKLQKDYLHEGGIQVVMNRAIESGDSKQLLDFFELLVHRSYGIKSADGEEFEKNPELMRRFENQAFYSDLYMSFFQDEGRVGQEFIRQVMPAALIAKAEANVRGEGELAQKAAAATAFKPDARTAFEQARANLQDHLPKQEQPVTTQNIFDSAQAPQTPIGEVVEVQEKTSPPYQGLPATPQAPSNWQPTPVQETQQSFRVPAEDPQIQAASVPMSREEWEAANGMYRPQHENTVPQQNPGL
jgi:hypothetical protein